MIDIKLPETLNYLYRLKNMIRFNNTMTIKNESVAEHSFFVTLFTLLLCVEKGVSKDELLKNLIIAICHDLPELEISDIPHNVKKSMPSLNLSIYTKEKEWYNQNMPDMVKDIVDNDFSLNKLVEYSDVLSVIQFCENEMNLGNKNIEEIYKNSIKRLKELNL